MFREISRKKTKIFAFFGSKRNAKKAKISATFFFEKCETFYFPCWKPLPRTGHTSNSFLNGLGWWVCLGSFLFCSKIPISYIKKENFNLDCFGKNKFFLGKRDYK